MKSSILTRLIFPVVVTLACLSAMFTHAALPQVFNPSNGIFVRPGGTSFTWTYGTGTTPQPGFPGTYNVTQISYHDVPPQNLLLTRGRFEFSTDSGGSWATYPAGINNNTSFTTTAGKIWRFVDTLGGNTTTTNSIGFAYFLQGPPSNVGTGATIIPDNAPTDLTADRSTVFDTLPQGSTLATVTPVDTGATRDGWWVLESQSVPNLFAISFDRNVGNKVALTLSTGTMPAPGTVVTVTLRYHDLYQTDDSGNPINGQGFSKQLSFTVTSEVSNELTLGNDVAVNTFTTNNQSSPAVATLTTGNLAVVWQSASQGGKSPATNSGIYGQILSSTGTAVGSEFVVSNAGAAVDEIAPAVTALDNGRYVVAYSTKSGADYDVAYRIVESNGTVGSQLIANSTTAGDQSGPSIVTLTDGSFVIAWYSSTGEIRARQFAAAAGAPVAAEVLFDSSGFYASVAALSSGSYAVAWVDGNVGEIKVKVNGGSAVSTGIITAYYASPRVTGLTGGGFVLASESYNGGTNQSQIEVARYDNSGAIQGGKFQANTVSTGSRYAASVAGLSGGGFVVGWVADNGDFELNGIFGRRYTSTGTAVDASEFQINQHRAGDQAYPAITAMPSDAFGTVWTDITAASVAAGTYLGDIEARIFSAAGPPPVAVTSLNTANASPSNASFVNWTLTFASPVNGLTASNFTLSGAAAAGSGVASPGTSNGGLTWTIPVSTGSTDGPLTLNLANDTGLSSTISTTLPYAGQSYTIDKSPPTVLSVTRMTPSNQTTNLTTVTFLVTYSEPVSLNAPETGHFAVIPVNGSDIVGSVTSVTGSGATRQVTVNLTSGLGEFRLRVID